MEDNDRLCAVMSAVLGHTAQKELLDAALVVFSHDNSWSLKILSPFADDGTNGVLISVEVGDFNLVWDLGGFHFAYKPLFYEAFCCAYLLHRRRHHTIRLPAVSSSKSKANAQASQGSMSYLHVGEQYTRVCDSVLCMCMYTRSPQASSET